MSKAGSNYVIESLTDPTTAMAVIKTYDKAPDQVKSQMQSMFGNGQRKIAFVIWFAPSPLNDTGPDSIVINSDTGLLTSQYKANLLDVVPLAQQIGFTEVAVRFQGLYAADVQSWTSWQEAQYQQNQSFIISTCSLAAQFGAIFDLGVDQLASSNSQVQQYLIRLWQAYVSQFGPVNATFAISTGSAARAGLFARNLVQWIRNAGFPLPPFYAAAVYGNELAKLRAFHGALVKLGEGGKQIIVQECFYNDATAAAQFKKAKAAMKFRSIYQWPLPRGLPDDFPNYAIPPINANAYAGL